MESPDSQYNLIGERHFLIGGENVSVRAAPGLTIVGLDLAPYLRLQLSPNEIKNYFEYSLAFLRKYYPGGFDPSSAALLAISLALSKYQPFLSPEDILAGRTSASFKTYLTRFLKTQGRFDRELALSIKTNTPWNEAYEIAPIDVYLPFTDEPFIDPYPALILSMDLYKALYSLPEQNRRVVVNKLVLDHSLGDISRHMNTPIMIVKQIYEESIIFLRFRLEEYS